MDYYHVGLLVIVVLIPYNILFLFVELVCSVSCHDIVQLVNNACNRIRTVWVIGDDFLWYEGEINKLDAENPLILLINERMQYLRW